MDWQFIDSGYADGRTNMRIDEELAGILLTQEGPSTLRVYGWNPPAISLGWNQAEEEILADEAARRGIDVVRRPTGGRAILHAAELTYSVVMTADHESISNVYRRISEGLLAGLGRLGVHASLEKSQAHFPSLYERSDSAACFVSAARHEIKADGKKLVGSAQRRYRDTTGREVVLQHGSILFDRSHRDIVNYLALSDQDRARLSRLLAERTTDLSEILGRPVSFSEVAAAVKEGAAESWGIRFEPESVMVSERSEQ